MRFMVPFQDRMRKKASKDDKGEWGPVGLLDSLHEAFNLWDKALKTKALDLSIT